MGDTTAVVIARVFSILQSKGYFTDNRVKNSIIIRELQCMYRSLKKSTILPSNDSCSGFKNNVPSSPKPSRFIEKLINKNKKNTTKMDMLTLFIFFTRVVK